MRFTGRLGVSRFDGAWACARGGRALCVLAALAAVVVPMGLASSALAAEATGQISGAVTDASTRVPIEGIEVCAQPSGEKYNVGCASTEVNGEYTLSKLLAGAYTVQFFVGHGSESELDYASQYYNDKSHRSEGEAVTVTAGGTTSDIDAAMQLGGIITGKVTAVATQDPIEGLRVCGWSISDESGERCPETNANGEYTLTHLEAGTAAVEFGTPFSSNLGYVTEFYSGKASLAEATPLSVTPGVTITGIDATLHAIGEESVKPPVVETIPTSAAPTATPLPKATPLVTLMGSKLVISGNAASVHVVCSKAACQGSIELVAQAASKRHSGRAATTRKKALVLATGSFSLAEGKSRTIVLRLTAAGKRMLAHAGRRHPVTARLTLSVQGGRATIESVLAV
jgi:hypothetical protein